MCSPYFHSEPRQKNKKKKIYVFHCFRIVKLHFGSILHGACRQPRPVRRVLLFSLRKFVCPYAYDNVWFAERYFRRLIIVFLAALGHTVSTVQQPLKNRWPDRTHPDDFTVELTDPFVINRQKYEHNWRKRQNRLDESRTTKRIQTKIFQSTLLAWDSVFSRSANVRGQLFGVRSSAVKPIASTVVIYRHGDLPDDYRIIIIIKHVVFFFFFLSVKKKKNHKNYV